MEDLQETEYSDLDFTILQMLHRHGQPMGSGALHYSLRDGEGVLSAPTIGRRLRDLEQRGLVAKVSVEGRILTPVGAKLYHALEQERALDNSGERLLRLLKQSGRKDIMDQLTARRLIECETAALAAMNATPEQIQRLDQKIADGFDLIGHGHSGVVADVEFHEIVAEASGNSVLSARVTVMRSQVWINQVISAIRAKVGSRLVVDHEEIVRAIRSRDHERARAAMQEHLTHLIRDIDRYWEQFLHEPRF